MDAHIYVLYYYDGNDRERARCFLLYAVAYFINRVKSEYTQMQLNNI